jgi:hypothetical protein
MRQRSRHNLVSGLAATLGVALFSGDARAADTAPIPPKAGSAKAGAAKTANAPSPVAAARDGSAASSEEKARAAFESFTREWMQKMQASTATRSTGPEAHGGVRFSRYANDFTTELRPTGSDAAPFVGLLRYREDQMACKDQAAQQCEVESATNVTEIFRWQGGRWIY